MNKIKKLLTMGLAVTAAVSAMSISAFAKDTYVFENGLTVETYTEEEVKNMPVPMDVDNFNFNLNMPKYPSAVYLTSTESVRNLELDKGQSIIRVYFNQSNAFHYYSIYDVTAGEYFAGSSSSMIHINGDVGSAISFAGLTGGHTYRIALSDTYAHSGVSGHAISY